jgi:hypothetical protein
MKANLKMQSSSEWRTVGHCPRDALIAARLEAHWATQLVAAVGEGKLRTVGRAAANAAQSNNLNENQRP